MRLRTSWHSLAAVVLLALLATLGTLQYRWLGEVSESQRERMRTSLRTRVSDFSEAFDREVGRTYAAFHVEGDPVEARLARVLTDAFTRWQSTAAAPDLVDAVYLVEGGPDHVMTIRKLDPSRAALEPVDWPPALGQWRERVVNTHASIPGGGPPLWLPNAVDASIPALIVGVPTVTRFGDGKRVQLVTRPDLSTRVVLIVLNADQLRHQVLDPLVARYFGSGDASEYLVTIVRRDNPSQVVYTSRPHDAVVDEAEPGAEATAGLFDVRVNELWHLNAPTAMHREGDGPSISTSKMAITIFRRTGREGGLVTMGNGPDSGAWQLRARYRNGSLEALVAQSRRRNLAASLGVLGLLAASFVLIVASAARQQRLARQQIEFVAAVSHELRTPLAVIRSAGENLADGVVATDEQVRRYGSLIETEGRRLSDMVERVMTFAGITSGAAVRARGEVDLSRIVDDAIANARAEGRDRGVNVTCHVDGAIPNLVGDGDALGSALQNVLGNAVKYSPNDAVVDVDVGVEGSRVRITVIDRGIGIDADELPQIFRPFFRGRRALEAQIRGTGIGLSVVRHVVEAHRGDIRVESRPGAGTTVTVVLPIVRHEEASADATVRSAPA